MEHFPIDFILHIANIVARLNNQLVVLGMHMLLYIETAHDCVSYVTQVF